MYDTFCHEIGSFTCFKLQNDALYDMLLYEINSFAGSMLG